MITIDTLEKINLEIFKKFPYLAGSQPSQKDLPNQVTQLSYSAAPDTASGIPLPITVKVKVSPQGKIVNISTTK